MSPATSLSKLLILVLLALATACGSRRSGDGFETLSPFETLEVSGDTVKVRVEGADYECLAIDGLAIPEMLAFCRRTYAEKWEKRFAEDLVEVLDGMGHAPGGTVRLKLREAGGKEIEKTAAMTKENRKAIWSARNPDLAASARAARRDPSQPLTSGQVAVDLEVLARAIADTHAYAHVAGVDAGAELAALRARLGDAATVGMLADGMAHALARLGDCHARVRGLTGMLTPGYAPFRIEEIGGRLVALANGGQLVDGELPYVTALDGRPVDEWLRVASATVPACSETFVRAHALERLALIAHLRAEAGWPASPSVVLTLAGEAGGTREQALPLSDRVASPTRGMKTRHGMLDGNVGYLRIESMDDDPEFLGYLKRAAGELASARAWILDVRGNGGGSRDALRILMPMLMRADDPPAVVNVAAYRLPPDERPERPEGHLENRFMYPATWTGWSPDERAAIERVAVSFAPAWTPPAEDFTAWHYFVISPGASGGVTRSGGLLVVLMDGGCFSATDIFLGALKGRPNVTLLGTPSGGGSGRARGVELPESGLEVMLSTMTSYRADGSRYDGVGVVPDVLVPRTLSDILGRTDSQLDAAQALVAAPTR